MNDRDWAGCSRQGGEFAKAGSAPTLTLTVAWTTLLLTPTSGHPQGNHPDSESNLRPSHLLPESPIPDP